MYIFKISIYSGEKYELSPNLAKRFNFQRSLNSGSGAGEENPPIDKAQNSSNGKPNSGKFNKKKKKKQGVDPSSSSSSSSYSSSSSISDSVPFLNSQAPMAANRVGYNRDDVTLSSFASNVRLTPIDKSTSRKHSPFITSHKKFNVTGSSGSILNMAFRSSVFELLSSPKWMSNKSSIKGFFSIEFLESYFGFVSDVISIRTLCLDLLCLYDDFQTNSIFKEDVVMESLLSDYFRDFIPRRSQFTAAIGRVDTLLESFFLPDAMVKTVVEGYKITSLPYHGFETFSVNSLLISLPDNVFKRESLNAGFSSKEMVISFPFDKKIVSEGKTYANTLRVLEYYINSLSKSISYDGEFNDIHAIFRCVIPEWAIHLEKQDSFVYTRPMSDAERISLLNLNVPLCALALGKKIKYTQYIGDAVINDAESIIKAVSYGPDISDASGFVTINSSVNIDDTGTKVGEKPVFCRDYDSATIWHDSKGGFNLSVVDMLEFNFPLSVELFDRDSNKIIKPNQSSVNEPGLSYSVADNTGLTHTYCFYNSMVIDRDSSINIITSSCPKTYILDYHASIGRKSGHVYDFSAIEKESKKFDINVVVDFDKINISALNTSHPTLRKVRIDLNALSGPLYSHFCSIWSSDTCKSLYSKQNTEDVRSEYRKYSIIQIVGKN